MVLYEYRDGHLYWTGKASRQTKIGSRIGTKRPDGYLTFGYRGKSLRVHRVIWEIHNGAIPKGYEVDHINGIRDDNRIENLRLVTRSQNNMNCKVHKDNKLGIKNVVTRQRGNCLQYIARIRVDGKTWTKSSTVLSEVVAWLEVKRAKVHGEYANSGKR